MLGLEPTNPTRMFAATPRRCRRKLPESLKVERVDGIEPGAIYDGIRRLNACDAILTCKGKILPERKKTRVNKFIPFTAGPAKAGPFFLPSHRNFRPPGLQRRIRPI